MNESFYIKSYGCARRSIDTARIRQYFERNGCQFTSHLHKADYIVFVSCGVIPEKVKNLISTLKKNQKLQQKIILYGCLPLMNPDKVNAVFIGNTIATKNIDDFDKITSFSMKMIEIEDANISFGEQNLYYYYYRDNLYAKNKKKLNWFYYVIGAIYSAIKKTYNNKILKQVGIKDECFTLRISEGCLGNCTYCTIRYAIGKHKSKGIEVIKQELAKALETKQYKLNIIASDTGAYGIDIGSSFPELLKMILDSHPAISIEYIEDLYPVWMIKYEAQILELFKTNRIKTLLTAIQSGSEKILKSMRRYHNVEKMVELMQNIKKVSPNLIIRSQIIIGFPGETEEDFLATIDVVKRCKFNELDIFSYQEVDNADSYHFLPKVPDDIIENRINRMKNALKIKTHVNYKKTTL